MSMYDKLAMIESRYDEIEQQLATPEITADYEKVVVLSKERAKIQEIVAEYRTYKQTQSELDDARKFFQEEDDADMREMARTEVNTLEEQITELEEKLRLLLLPKDERDDKNIIIEIRAGAGGDEAAIFAADLFRMYTRYAENNKWKVNVTSENEIGGGGYKRIEFEIKGQGSFSRLKYEGGTHRVQRVPTTESQGRIHTSTATVAVIAEMDEVDIDLDMNDVRVDVFRSQGAGGQSVNTTDSAVRMTHIPTGIVVEMQDERSQLQNRIRAKQVLVNRLYELEMQRQMEEQEAARRGQVGSGDRAEKIRTYNYPQNRVTDHRINYSSYNLPVVMDGDIDDFIDQLITSEQAAMLSATEGD